MGQKESDPGSSQKPTTGTGDATAKKRWYAKKITITIGLVISLYFISYGPAVAVAINQYGQTAPFTEALYTPAA